MYKFLFILVTLFSIGGYLYFSGNDSSAINEEENLAVNTSDSTTPESSKNILAEKNLHEAFEKILDKKAIDERSVASRDLPEEAEIRSEDFDQDTYSSNTEGDFEQEFSDMSPIERERTIQNLRFEISQDERLLEQMEIDQRNGLNITEADIAAITQRTENKKMKLDTFTSMMNAHEE